MKKVTIAYTIRNDDKHFSMFMRLMPLVDDRVNIVHVNECVNPDIVVLDQDKKCDPVKPDYTQCHPRVKTALMFKLDRNCGRELEFHMYSNHITGIKYEPPYYTFNVEAFKGLVKVMYINLNRDKLPPNIHPQVTSRVDQAEQLKPTDKPKESINDLVQQFLSTLPAGSYNSFKVERGCFTLTW